MRVLLVEDDELLVRSLLRIMSAAGYVLDTGRTFWEASALAETEEYSLAVVDIGLPDGNGLDLVRRWRKQGMQLPILILTARGDWQEKVDGLDAGADDYLVKPFHQEEFLARLKALVRRSHGVVSETLEVSGYTLDDQQQRVRTPDGSWHPLTGTEYRLLRYFMLRTNRILSKDQLIEQLYSLEDEPSHNLIEAYVKRLRRILGSEAIQTLRGQGYVFPSR